MTEKEFYQIFPKDKTPSFFWGDYNAKNGGYSYMYGIECVIAYVASKVSSDFADKISEEFFMNMVKSEEKC